MEQPQKARLEDVLPYKPEQYLSDEEFAWVRNTFGGKSIGAKVLRKIMLPSALDKDLPIEEMQGDVWMQGIDFAGMQAAEIKPIVLGRQEAIKFILGALIKLKVIANSPIPSPLNAKDSTK